MVRQRLHPLWRKVAVIEIKARKAVHLQVD